MIKVGDTVPNVSVKHMGADGMADLDTGSVFKGKTVVMFGVPAAYSPTCSEKHVPGFVSHAADLKSAGVDAIVCHSVNDPFVMKAWGNDQNVGEDILMLADWAGELAKALGTDADLSGAGLGVRSKRYALVAKDGKVSHIAVEDAPPNHGVSSAEEVLKVLRS